MSVVKHIRFDVIYIFFLFYLAECLVSRLPTPQRQDQQQHQQHHQHHLQQQVHRHSQEIAVVPSPRPAAQRRLQPTHQPMQLLRPPNLSSLPAAVKKTNWVSAVPCLGIYSNNSNDDDDNNNNDNNNICIQRCNSVFFTPHCATNRLQHVRSSGPGAIVCESHATHRELITWNMSC